jgi:hypothetical protein
VLRIDGHFASQRRDDQVHVFHRDRAEHDFVAHHEGAHEAEPRAEADLNRAYVRDFDAATVCERDVTLIGDLEIETLRDPRRKAKHHRARVRERRYAKRPQLGLTRVAELDLGVRKSHRHSPERFSPALSKDSWHRVARAARPRME